jgi:type II secretory pathway pseudopilin PulG
LIELLVVIAIIAILAGLLFPAVQGAFKRAKTTQAINDISAIKTALQEYYTQYTKYPVAAASGDVEGSMFDALRGLNDGLNPKRIIFLETTNTIVNTVFSDLWGTPYKYAVDINYANEIIPSTHYGVLKGRTIGVFSYGPDKKSQSPQEADDDICSWK